MDESPRWTEPVSLTGRPASHAEAGLLIDPDLIPVEPAVPIVTFVLVGLNILVFVVMLLAGVSLISPDADDLIRFGANDAPLVTAGQYWRILTAAFVHVGIVHLAFNMFALFVVGPPSEHRFGRLPFLVLYLLSAAGSSLTSLASAPDVVSAGASGAVLGAYSGLLGLMLVRREARPADGLRPMLTSAAILIFVNVVTPWLRQGSGGVGIDVAGHIGGLVTGLAVGIALAVATRAPAESHRTRVTALVSAVGLALTAVALHRLPVVDDLQASLRTLATLEAGDVNAYNAAMGRVRLDQMKPVDLADRLEEDFVLRWLAERQRLTVLHVATRQQPALDVAKTHAADRAEMWRLASRALRSGDVTTALDVDTRAAQLAMVLRQLTTDLKVPDHDTTTDIAAELQRLQSTEQQSVSRLNRSLASLRASAVPAGQVRIFAADVEAQVLKPWNAERQALRSLPVPEYQQMHAKVIGDYMTLRADGWALLVRGLTTADGRLMQEASAKQKQAETLASTVKTSRVPTLPPKAAPHTR
jgi:membrane associated rhomboid family serine protease